MAGLCDDGHTGKFAKNCSIIIMKKIFVGIGMCTDDMYAADVEKVGKEQGFAAFRMDVSDLDAWHASLPTQPSCHQVEGRLICCPGYGHASALCPE